MDSRREPYILKSNIQGRYRFLLRKGQAQRKEKYINSCRGQR